MSKVFKPSKSEIIKLKGVISVISWPEVKPIGNNICQAKVTPGKPQQFKFLVKNNTDEAWELDSKVICIRPAL